MDTQEAYLRAILATVARQTFSVGTLIDIVGKNAGEKQFRAYNLCDGTKSQAEIAKELSLDPGNFSKTISRWIDAGIVIRIGQGRDVKPIHVYPIPDADIKKASKA